MRCVWQFRNNKRVSKDASSSIPASSTPSHELKMKQPMVTSEASLSSENFCNICLDTKAESDMFSNAKVCSHLFCSDCIRTYISLRINQNVAKVKCPHPICSQKIVPDVCRSIIPKEVLERWEDALRESLILAKEKFYCPFKDCSAMLVDAGDKAVTSTECPKCHRLFCARCKVPWHSGMNCRKFKKLLIKKDMRIPEDKMLMKLAKEKKWKRCPNCNFFVEKVEGCSHMVCSCGHGFCYRCGKSKSEYRRHYCIRLMMIRLFRIRK